MPQELKGRVLMYAGKPVEETMLHQGIYSTNKPNIHWEPNLTIEQYIEDTQFVSGVMDHDWPDEMYDNIRECEFRTVRIIIDSETDKMKSELTQGIIQ